MRAATTRELIGWDALIARNPDGGNILQSRAWGEFKRFHGWRPRYLIHERGARQIAVLFLVRRIPGLGELWYSPKGPGVASEAELIEVLADRAAFGRAFTVKVEPELRAGETDMIQAGAAGLIKADHDVQISRATIVIDLTGEEDALLASFKSKCRYNIRLAARKGVEVREMPMDDACIDVMLRLMSATQERAGFTLRSRAYFTRYWRLQHAAGQGRFFFAFRSGEVLAGVFITTLGSKAWYKDGGSVKRHSELMAPHLLQWEVMRWLRGQGVTSYDLVAVPRPGELTPEHPMFGLHRFKSGFSQEVIEFVGTWDLVLSRPRAEAWNRVGERLAHQWTLRVHRDLFY